MILLKLLDCSWLKLSPRSSFWIVIWILPAMLADRQTLNQAMRFIRDAERGHAMRAGEDPGHGFYSDDDSDHQERRGTSDMGCSDCEEPQPPDGQPRFFDRPLDARAAAMVHVGAVGAGGGGGDGVPGGPGDAELGRVGIYEAEDQVMF